MLKVTASDDVLEKNLILSIVSNAFMATIIHWMNKIKINISSLDKVKVSQSVSAEQFYWTSCQRK